MRLFFRIFIILSITAYNFLLISTCAHAATEFSTSYDIEYTVDLKGTTSTRQHIVLKNLYENIYATQYSIIIGSTNIKDITASDNFGSIQPQITTLANSTKINLNFDKHIIGKDKERNVTITYKTPDFATVKGQVLEVGFPLLQNSKEMEDYEVTIYVPQDFGKATQIIPTPGSEAKSGSFSGYSFSKDSLNDVDSISATFGTQQIYRFLLTYNLENPNAVKGRTEIALPADTNYQQIMYTSIQPKPEQVKVDSDGNWLAEYVLDPKAKLSVTAAGKAKLSFFPRSEFTVELSEEQYKLYTQPQKYWESDAENIRNLSAQLSTPKQIYDYLITNFSYDYERLNSTAVRMGASQALTNPNNAICMEFTDAFIAIARAAGIPAREHNGYAYTENDKLRPLSLNQDILHAWPEYYDKGKKQWIQIDPTWGNTTGGLNFFDKFDLDHISFVRHGADSSYPITAGSYKYPDVETKDVEIKFDSTFEPLRSVEFSSLFPSVGITGIPVQGYIQTHNTGSTALYSYPVKANMIHNGSILLAQDISIPVLPPYGSYKEPIAYKSSWQDRGGTYEIRISSADSMKTSHFKLKPMVNYTILVPVLGLLLAVIVFLMIRSSSKKRSGLAVARSRSSIQPRIFRR